MSLVPTNKILLFGFALSHLLYTSLLLLLSGNSYAICLQENEDAFPFPPHFSLSTSSPVLITSRVPSQWS